MNAPARTLGAAPAQRRETYSPTLTDLGADIEARGHSEQNIAQASWELGRAETDAELAEWARKWGRRAIEAARALVELRAKRGY